MKFYTNFYRSGKTIAVRGYENGERFVNYIQDYEPVLFTPTADPSEWKNLNGTNVEKKKFGNMKEARDFVKRYDDVSGFKVYGSTMHEYVYIHRKYGSQFDLEHIRVGTFDIEVGSEGGFSDAEEAWQPIITITIACNGEYYAFGLDDYETSAKNVTYFKCADERDLLCKFLGLWRELDLDIITGWNIKFFDIPYLYNRMQKVVGTEMAKKLSPTGWINPRESTFYGKTQTEYDLVGMSTLDYMELYRKFVPNKQESYKLDFITHVELNEGKLDYSEVESLHQLYKRDFQKFMDYNIRDVQLVERLEDKMKLIETALIISYYAKVNYVDCMKQVKLWDVLIHNHLFEKKIAIPPKEHPNKNSQYAGGYVKPPQTGMHDWVMSFDLNSLYPSLIIQYNISPEKLIRDEEAIDFGMEKMVAGDYRNTAEHSLTANRFFYRKDSDGFLPAILSAMMEDRRKYKDLMIEAEKELEEVENEIRELTA